MASLLIRSIRYLVTCDDKDQLLEDVDLYCEDGFIRQIGPHLDVAADRTIDANHMLCYPGLVNTHHHLYQVFSRNLPQVQNMELFDWLKTLYEIWKNLDEDVIRLSSPHRHGRADEARLHHLLRPPLCLPRRTAGDLHRRPVCRRGRRWASGCMPPAAAWTSAVKDGGLPPDSVVQTVDEIMTDSPPAASRRTTTPRYGSMHQRGSGPLLPLLRVAGAAAAERHSGPAVRRPAAHPPV